MTDLSCSLSFHPQIDREDVIYIVECYSAIRRMKLCYLQKNGWNWGYYTLYRRQEARSYPRKRNTKKQIAEEEKKIIRAQKIMTV